MDIDFVVTWVNMDDPQWYVRIRNNDRVINQFFSKRDDTWHVVRNILIFSMIAKFRVGISSTLNFAILLLTRRLRSTLPVSS